MKAAYLWAKGKKNSQIAERLQIEPFQVTRDLEYADDQGLLERTLKLGAEDRLKISCALDGGRDTELEKMLSAKIPPSRRVEVTVSRVTVMRGKKPGWTAFCSHAGTLLASMLLDSKKDARIGIAWGEVLSSVLRHCLPESSWVGGPLRFIPVRGDALIDDLDHTPSAICHELNEKWNRTHGKRSFSLRSIPPVLTTRLSPEFRGYFEGLDDFRTICGSETQRGHLDKLDVLFSSLGSPDTKSRYTKKCYKIAGIDPVTQGWCGDLAGVPLCDESDPSNEDREALKEYESRLLGLSRPQLKQTATKGRVVVVTDYQPGRERAILEACRQGLVTDLIIDEELRARLKRRLRSRR
jgi:DNA-binding transcriptional regulator LsrR (DeoR family)